MSISAPPGQPSITETLSRSFQDALALTKKNATVVSITLILGVIAAVGVIVSGWKPNSAVFPVALEVWLAPAYFALIVLSYYALAAAVRTINPEYRMTAGQFFGFAGYSLLIGLLTGVAGIFFVIPAYWVGVKIMLTPYTYIVTNGEPGALKRTWQMTTGYYWQTVGMMLLSSICAGIIAYVAFLICGFAMYAVPASVIVFGPLALAVLVWLIHAHALVYVRWTNDLLPRENALDSMLVPA